MHYCEGIVANKAVTESFSTHQLTAAYYQLGLLASACKNSIVILCNTEELSTKLDLALICSELRTIVREAKAFDQPNFNQVSVCEIVMAADWVYHCQSCKACSDFITNRVFTSIHPKPI